MNRKLFFGITLAAIFWFIMFSISLDFTKLVHYNYFWYAMTFSTLTLTAYSLVIQKGKLKELFEFKWKYIWIGIIHAILLYLLSRFGMWLLVYMFDWAAPQIEAIYQTRNQASPYFIGALLFFLIAPAEEIFWRGYVQDSFLIKFGKRNGTMIAIFLYSFVHIWALNPLLLLAALVLGIHWSIMYTKFGTLTPGIVSHAVWDCLIFVIFPVNI
ncbi:MAG: CPBP family intramembrane metalloprotease [Candidatus Kapabacteria bacterium]|nr:CPBP family intramembrane metalloprotease [Ignavibacteriota bacterium]MCW5885140.1 CPBP family intramembrane metalloprotease [Candidatus Kapabacteria bacterium]